VLGAIGEVDGVGCSVVACFANEFVFGFGVVSNLILELVIREWNEYQTWSNTCTNTWIFCDAGIDSRRQISSIRSAVFGWTIFTGRAGFGWHHLTLLGRFASLGITSIPLIYFCSNGLFCFVDSVDRTQMPEVGLVVLCVKIFPQRTQ